jgi:glycosyltransferase involved in cell wall biosynthesis
MSQRVALFLPSMAGGGAERVVLAQARELVARGHLVDLVLVHGGGELLSLVPSAVNVIELRSRRIASAILPLVRYLRRARPNALHAVMWPSTVVAVAAHRLARSTARLMISDQVALSQQIRAPAQRALLRLTTRLLYPLADFRIVCSLAAADDNARIAHIRRDRFEVIYNPIDPPRDVVSNAQVEALWGDAEERIITVGSLKDQKNHALLLRAFARLKDHPRAGLTIVGEGSLRPELEQLARDLGIDDRVTMPGFFLDSWPFLASAQLFVLSSDYEGFANVVAEALYAGLRVVSTDCVAGPAEILDQGRYGTLVQVGSEEALAIAMAGALSAPGDPNAARARALQISGPHTVARYCDLLTDRGAAVGHR